MKAWYIGVATLLGGIVGVALSSAGIQAMIAIGVAIAIVLFATWLGILFHAVDEKVGQLAGIAGVVVVLITILGSVNIVQKVVPICGDGICTANECLLECEDCGPGQCDDGVCQSFETCTSGDCPCPSSAICVPERAGSSTNGCYGIRCGDGICDGGESSKSCCSDCSCSSGFTCRGNACYLDPPRITFVPYFAGGNISATAFAANPLLIVNNSATPLVGMDIRNTISTAHNVSFTLTFGNLSSKEFFIGTMLQDARAEILWYLEEPLDTLWITEDTSMPITINLTYLDDQQIAHESQWQYPLIVTPRNTTDKFTHLVFFVTPEDVNLFGTTPKMIWNKIDVKYANIGFDFPAATLERREGSGKSIAMVLASGFIQAGLKTNLVESDYGFFVRVREGSQFVMLDPTLIDERYEDAIVRTPGYAVYDIESTWHAYNMTPLTINK